MKIVYNYSVFGEDVGLNCNSVIYGTNEENVVESTMIHMFEHHAIQPEEMTACMKVKIKENMRVRHSPPPIDQLAYNNPF